MYNDRSDPYFKTLTNLVEFRYGSDVHTEQYRMLLEQLYNTPFLWFVQFDGNRVSDGYHLRASHIQGKNVKGPCSFLEMLIAMSGRLESMTGFEKVDVAAWWFWHMLDNARLTRFTNSVYFDNENTHDQVDVILESIVRRTYQSNGRGGFFPLNNPETDQRRVELWYQMSAYLLEHEELC